jgi:UDP:flavonoid glycosyltransferase YjiC (YdhE family)
MRILYVSGSIGLGHAARDLAIARELRRLRPAVEIDWLAGEPGRRLLVDAGENVLGGPSAVDDTATVEAVAGAFRASLVDYMVHAGRPWIETVLAFARVTRRCGYDLVIGDEAYEVSIGLAWLLRDRPPFVVLFDFMGFDPTSSRLRERAGAYAVNQLWIQTDRRHWRRQSALMLFLGEAEDVPDRRLGPLLPNRRAHARACYQFCGHALPFDPAELADRGELRRRLGYDEAPLVIAAIGGTAVGRELLQLCIDAYPALTELVPGVRLVLVCGPRLDPASFEVPDGVAVRGYVPKLYEHLAACDVAVVQGGGTTTLELTALRRPFLYFPLEGHCEQEVAVAGRLARHGAGMRMTFSRTTPDELAVRVAGLVGTEPDYPPIASDGARRAAEAALRLADGRSVA